MQRTLQNNPTHTHTRAHTHTHDKKKHDLGVLSTPPHATSYETLLQWVFHRVGGGSDPVYRGPWRPIAASSGAGSPELSREWRQVAFVQDAPGSLEVAFEPSPANNLSVPDCKTVRCHGAASLQHISTFSMDFLNGNVKTLEWTYPLI